MEKANIWKFWRDEETALDRVLRELPALQPRAAHVLAVLPLHPAGGTETQGDHAHPSPPRGSRGGGPGRGPGARHRPGHG